MSRSRRRPIFKEKTMLSKAYRKLLRNKEKDCARKGKFIPDRKALIDNYDRCDTIIDLRFSKSEFWSFSKIIWSRK